jgi:GT2 family glycosyltransferase
MDMNKPLVSIIMPTYNRANLIRPSIKSVIDQSYDNWELLIIGGGVVIVNEKHEELFRYYKKETDTLIRKYALFSNPFSHTTVMFRKDVAIQLGGYRTNYLEDWDFWLRIGKAGKMYNLPEYYADYLAAGQNYSLVDEKQQTVMILKLIWSFRHDYPSYRKALFFNSLQYGFLFLPFDLRRRVQTGLKYLKRKYF